MTRTRRFDLIEVVLIAAGLALVAMIVTLSAFSTLDAQQPYKAKYGAKVSDGPEEWIARDFFNDQRGGVFVDVGAADYREKSNTYTLETALGWSGVAVDAQAQYADGYRTHRPRTKFVAAFVSDRVGSVAFNIPAGNPGVASADPIYVAGVDTIARTEQIPTVTLTAILDAAGVTRIDYLSMDIEREEPKALAGFDIARFKPRLVCIEGHVPVRQQILDYFAAHGYVVVGKYWNVDGMNLYFMPLR
jgi:FkbM family methyltransferase